MLYSVALHPGFSISGIGEKLQQTGGLSHVVIRNSRKSFQQGTDDMQWLQYLRICSNKRRQRIAVT